MRSTRITPLLLAFGVGCAGAWAAETALAQDAEPRREEPAKRRAQADDPAKELERLLEELLGRPRAKKQPERRARAPRAPEPAPRARDPRSFEEQLQAELEELMRLLGPRRLTPEERERRQREMEEARREFERRMAEMNRRMAELRKRMEEDMRRMFGEDPFGPGGLFGGENNPFGPNGPFGRGRDGGKGRSGGFNRSFKLGPGGVTEATITEGDTTITGKRNATGVVIKVTKPGPDGRPKTTEYRAKDEAEFKQKYPEQAELYGQLFGRGRGFFVEFPPRKGTGGTQRTRSAKKASLNSTKLGFTADPLSGMLRTQLGVPAGQGLYVKSVTPGGWAERAGLVARDVILFVGGAPVTGLADLEEVISGKADGDATITLVLQRQGVRLELGVPK